MLQKLSKLNTGSRWTLSIVIPAACSWVFTIIDVYWFRDYGASLFILLPLFMGFVSTVIYGYGRKYTAQHIWRVTALSVTTYSLGLILFAIEGAICIVMAAPLAIVIAMVGSVLGHYFLKYRTRSPLPVIVGFTLMLPFLMGFENMVEDEPALHTVTTSVIIHASPQEVWDKVVAFSRIEEPEELLFRAGISYPTHAEITGTGVGATRYCNFTTGRFVEPITTWNAPELLEFSVKEMPEPLKELSPYDIKPTHLHGYFVSVKGRFQLVPLEGNRTELIGTTWYYHKIKPAAYWKLWTNYILHKIHNRVLQHIKKDAEL